MASPATVMGNPACSKNCPTARPCCLRVVVTWDGEHQPTFDQLAVLGRWGFATRYHLPLPWGRQQGSQLAWE